MNADRVIKSNAEFFNTASLAVRTWRRNAIREHGDGVGADMGSMSAQRYPTILEKFFQIRSENFGPFLEKTYLISVF